MKDISSISDEKLVNAANERLRKISEIADQFEQCEKKINQLEERGKMLMKNLEETEKEFLSLLDEAENRNIKIP